MDQKLPAGAGESMESAGTGNSARDPVSLTWPRRLACAAYAFAATAVYAGSFFLLPEPGRFARPAAAVGLAAAVSWPGFGAALLAVSRVRPSVLAWADVCLRTMIVGNTVLLLSVLANGTATWQKVDVTVGYSWELLHSGVLAAANLSMAAVFARGARRLGMSVPVSLAMWFGVLGGLFALTLVLFRNGGMY